MRQENYRQRKLERGITGFSHFLLQTETVAMPAKPVQGRKDTHRLVLDSADDSIYLVDRAYRYLFMNKQHLLRLGVSSEDVLGLPYANFHSPEATRCFRGKVNEVFRTGKSVQQVHISRRDGKIFLRTFSPVREPGGETTAVTVISKDVSEIKKIEEKLRHLSITDELTGLLNRRGFFALADQQIALSGRLGKETCLLSADLDNLKEINDTFGHQEGDRVLIETAGILRETFRKSDVLTRFGGDEFVVLMTGAALDGQPEYVARLQRNLELHNARMNRGYRISISLGVVCQTPGSSCSLNDLLVQADTLMYEQKKNKKKLRGELTGMLFAGNNIGYPIPVAAGGQ